MKISDTAILIALTNAYENKKINAQTGLQFAADAYKLAIEINKKNKLKLSDKDTIDTVIYFIKEIAKGNDGIMGTRDDLMDAKTVEDITRMLETNLMEDLLWILKDTMTMKVTMYKTSFCLFKHCFLR